MSREFFTTKYSRLSNSYPYNIKSDKLIEGYAPFTAVKPTVYPYTKEGYIYTQFSTVTPVTPAMKLSASPSDFNNPRNNVFLGPLPTQFTNFGASQADQQKSVDNIWKSIL